MTLPWLPWILTLYGALTLTSMGAMSIGAVLVGLLTLTIALKDEKFRSHFREAYRDLVRDSGVRWILISGAVYLGVISASILQARIWPIAFGSFRLDLGWLSVFQDFGKLWYYPFGLVLTLLFRMVNPLRQTQVYQAWLVTSVLIAVWAPVQFVSGVPGNQAIPELPGFFHARGLSGHHLSAASIFIFPLFAWLGLARFFSLRAGRSRTAVWVARASALAVIVLLFLGWSRMLWVALPLGLFLFFVGRNRKAWLPTLMTAAVGLIGAFQLPFIHDRITSSLGVGTRFNLWHLNWGFFLERPILGVGWRKTSEVLSLWYQSIGVSDLQSQFISHAHNMGIELLSGTGVAGFLAWFGFNFAIFRFLLNSFRSSSVLLVRELSWALFCAWTTLLLNGLTQVNFWEGKVQHQMMWSLALFIAVKQLLERTLQES